MDYNWRGKHRLSEYTLAGVLLITKQGKTWSRGTDSSDSKYNKTGLLTPLCLTRLPKTFQTKDFTTPSVVKMAPQLRFSQNAITSVLLEYRLQKEHKQS